MKVCIIILTFTETILAAHLQSGNFKCGVKPSAQPDGTPIENRAFGSKKSLAIPNEWPWLVNLFYDPLQTFICGGTIVSEHHVLTAAHCVNPKKKLILKPRDIKVRLGQHNITANEESLEWFYPLDIFIHPDWEADKKKFDADLAILRADVPIPFSSTISPVCLWTELEEEEDSEGTVAGWGSREDSGTEGSDVPIQIQVRRVPSSRCYEDYSMIASLASARTFCAGAVFDKTGPCTGYSGQWNFKLGTKLKKKNVSTM